jgi:hypothetical protein
MLVDKARLFFDKAFWLMSELMLVLMTVMMWTLYEMCLRSFLDRQIVGGVNANGGLPNRVSLRR